MIGQESRGLRGKVTGKLQVTLVEHDGTMNKGSMKEDTDGYEFSINHCIKWPKARHGSFGGQS